MPGAHHAGRFRAQACQAAPGRAGGDGWVVRKRSDHAGGGGGCHWSPLPVHCCTSRNGSWGHPQPTRHPTPPLSMQTLLDKLDTLLIVQPGSAAAAAPQPQPTTPPAAADASAGTQSTAVPPAPVEEVAAAAAGEEQVEVSLQEGADGQVAFKLTLSPSKLAPAAAPEDEPHSADPGHMPVSPPSSATAAAASSRPVLPLRIELRPGALHDGAARGELPACCTCCMGCPAAAAAASCLLCCPSLLLDQPAAAACISPATTTGPEQSCCPSCVMRWTRASRR